VSLPRRPSLDCLGYLGCPLRLDYLDFPDYPESPASLQEREL